MKFILVLRELAKEIWKPLAIIFVKSRMIGTVPQNWRRVNTVPIFKKGKEEYMGNYRPVSLTSVPIKLLEKIIKQAIYKHLEDHY